MSSAALAQAAAAAALVPGAPHLAAAAVGVTVTAPAPSLTNVKATTTGPTIPQSAAASDIRKAVRDSLWPFIVFGKGSRDFGLEQHTMLRDNTDVREVGGWLRKARIRNGVRYFGEAHYHILDEEKGLCLIRSDAIKESISFQKIASVTAHVEVFEQGKKPVYFFRVVAINHGERKIWELSPADTSDRNQLVAWAAALQLRSKTYDALLDLDREKAVKVALWCQSLYRGFRGRIRAERKKAKKLQAKASNKFPTAYGIHRMVSGFLGSKQQQFVEDDSSSDEEDDVAAEDEDEEGDTSSQGSLEIKPNVIISSTTNSNITNATETSLTPVPPNRVSPPTAAGTIKGFSNAFTSFKRGLFRGDGLVIPLVEGDKMDASQPQSSSALSSSQHQGLTSTSNSVSRHVRFPSDRSLVLVQEASPSGSFRLRKRDEIAAPPPEPLKPLEVKVVEDEIWENQRWQAVAVRGSQVYRGWSDVALLPAERGAFSDRIGAMSWPSLDSIQCPAGWKVTHQWDLDLSSSKCNSEGWSYAQTFQSLDSNLASGRSNFAASARWLVRRRRWFRVREKDPSISLPAREIISAGSSVGSVVEIDDNGKEADDEDNRGGVDDVDDGDLFLSGWLGMRGITTGRWTNAFTFLPKKRIKAHLGVALCYFKKHARVFNDDMTFRYQFTKSFNNKHIKTKFLDNMCLVNDDCASREQPGLFTIHLCGEAEPRLLNAHSAEARVKWIQALREAIKCSPGPCYEAIANRRSMRKGAAWEFLRASGAVKDLVGGSVRGVKAGFLSIKQLGQTPDGSLELHRAESDPDILQVQSLREELRKSDCLWANSTVSPTSSYFMSTVSAPRKFSTDSLGSADHPPSTSNKRQSTPSSGNSKGPGSMKTISESQQHPSQTDTDPDDNACNSSLVSEPEETSSAPGGMSASGFILRKPSLQLFVPKKLKNRLSSTGSKGTLSSKSSPSLSPASPVPVRGGGLGLRTDLVLPDLVSAEISPTKLSGPVPGSPTRGASLFATEFEIPQPYENVLFDGYFDMSVDDFDTFFFREEEFTQDLFALEKMYDIQIEPWTNGVAVGSEHRRQYRMPRNGVVPSMPAFHLFTRIQSVPGKGYCVDQVCSCPEAPFGTCFSADLRNVILADGPKKCRVIISQRITLLKSTMAQSFIKSATKKELVQYYKNLWTPFIRKWVVEKRAHLLAAAAVVTAPEQKSSREGVEGVSAVSSLEPAAATLNATLWFGAQPQSVFMILLILLLVVLIALLSAQVYLMSTRLDRLEALLLVASGSNEAQLRGVGIVTE